MVSINFNNRNLWTGLNLNKTQNLEVDKKIELTLRADTKLDGFEKTTDNIHQASTPLPDSGEHTYNGITIKWEKGSDGKYTIKQIKNGKTKTDPRTFTEEKLVNYLNNMCGGDFEVNKKT